MDPLGLLLEVVAIAVYPGGLFLLVLAWVLHRAGGLPRGTSLDARGLTAIIAATVAASMAALPGSPAASIPPPGGATPNLVVAMLLLAMAGALAASETWSPQRLALLGLSAASLLLIGLLAPSLSIPALTGAGGGSAEVARILAVIAALTVAPVLMQPYPAAGTAVARGTVVTATAEVVLSILVPPSLRWPWAPVAVVAVVVAVAFYGLLLRLGRGATQREHPSVVAVAAACAVAAIVAALIAARS
jgi:hypothetical protein